MKVNIFYSWQSDLGDNINKVAIRKMLSNAKNKIEEGDNFGDLSIYIGEATRDEAGSPNIPQTIIDKITESDIFVADVTTINKQCECGIRKTPNPNVMYELGFAVAKLGWKRILLIFNKGVADINDLPFDIDRHKVITYSINQNQPDTDIKSVIGSRGNSTLYEAIKKILDENPQKQCIRPGKTLEEIKKERDVQKIKSFLKGIHIKTINNFISSMPHEFHSDIEYFVGILQEAVEYNSNLFFLYDEKLEGLCREFYANLSNALSYDAYYKPRNDNKSFVWESSNNPYADDKVKQAHEKIKISIDKLKVTFNEILTIIRNNYIKEIDIDKIST